MEEARLPQPLRENFETLLKTHFEPQGAKPKRAKAGILKRLFRGFTSKPGEFLHPFFIMTGDTPPEGRTNRTRKQIDRHKKNLQKHLVEIRDILKVWEREYGFQYTIIAEGDRGSYRLEIFFGESPIRFQTEDAAGSLQAVPPQAEGSPTIRPLDRKQLQPLEQWQKRHVGRDQECDEFLKLLGDIDSSHRPKVTFNLHGFGGIGKTTLAVLFQALAQEAGIPVFPERSRDALIVASFSSWLSTSYGIDVQKRGVDTGEPWRHFLNIVPKRCVVLLDTSAQVDIAGLNRNLGAVTYTIKSEGSPHLLVICTRKALSLGEETYPLDGLVVEDIKALAKLRGWPEAVLERADELHGRTDGNPFMLECICENPQLWNEFQSGRLKLARRVARVYEILEQMWALLEPLHQEALAAIATLDHYARLWHHEWGEKEAEALFEVDWDGHLHALKAAACLREREPGKYVIHDEMRRFASPRIKNKSRILGRLGDIFSEAGNDYLSHRYWVEAEIVSRKGESQL